VKKICLLEVLFGTDGCHLEIELLSKKLMTN